MSVFEKDGASIYYEEAGEGPAILLIAPGGMKSSIQAWSAAPWNPLDELQGSFRVIAMDQRNAGNSKGTINAKDGWHTYVEDQIDLMDHLEIDQFMVAGMCIGGPYIFKLLEKAEARIKACVVFQTIGRDNNREEFYTMFDNWAGDVKSDQGPASGEALRGLRENMFGGERVLFSVEDDFLQSIQVPMCVLMGSDLYHPESASRFVADLVRKSLFIEEWKEGEEKEKAKTEVIDFLLAHSKN